MRDVYSYDIEDLQKQINKLESRIGVLEGKTEDGQWCYWCGGSGKVLFVGTEGNLPFQRHICCPNCKER